MSDSELTETFYNRYKYNRNMKICFICTGNACRSPFAEEVTRKLINDEGIAGIEVYSLGTLDWGKNPRDEGMRRTAEELGYELSGETTYMTHEALMQADRIIVFENVHRDEVTRYLAYPRWDRIILFDKIAFGKETEVQDPHCQSAATYMNVARHIESGCKAIVEQLKGL